MLQENVGFNVSPTAWDAYPTIGRNGTFVSDRTGVINYFGDLAGKTEITIPPALTTQIEKDMGLVPRALQDGFKVRKVIAVILCLYSALSSAQETSPKSPSSNPAGYFFNVPSHGAMGDYLAKKAIEAGTSGLIKQASDAISGAVASDTEMYFSCKNPLTALAIKKAIEGLPIEATSKLKLNMLNETECSVEMKTALEKYSAKK